jgi:hypothetical protein
MDGTMNVRARVARAVRKLIRFPLARNARDFDPFSKLSE